MVYPLKCRSTSLLSLVGNNSFLTTPIYWAPSYHAYLMRRRKSEWYFPVLCFWFIYTIAADVNCGVYLFRDKLTFFFYLLTSLFARLHVKQMRSFVLSKLIQLRDLISEQSFQLEKGSLLNPLDMKLSLTVRDLLCGNLNCLYPTCASNLRIILTWRLWYGIYIFSPSFQRIEQWTWGHSNWSITLVLHSTGSIPCRGTERLRCFFGLHFQ